MSNTRRQYPFNIIEKKWQDFWERREVFRAWNPGEKVPETHCFGLRHKQLPPKLYILDMFPYPSGAGLHVGHPEGYTATDILSRYKRARGFNVLHPIGWDAFGLPAEQFAIKTGRHPREATKENINNFKRQIRALGFSYDWSREVDTTDPGYYKWTQWIFLKLYNSWFNPETNKAEPIDTLEYPPDIGTEEQRRLYRDSKRLAYVSEAPVNWCPDLGTVLANEEVVNGKSEVGGFPVIRKPMRQWMLRITAYAERLLNDLELLDWTPSLKEMQRNWIGRSEGAEARFEIPGFSPGNPETPRDISVFTTRPDTLFGATYMVLAPEHRLVDELIPDAWPEGTPENWKGKEESATKTPRSAVEAYRQYAAARSDLERTELTREKTGVFTGAYAVNPVNDERVPIWIADYVLASYGTGAIMAVPAHDTRDLEFATEFGLPVRVVVQAPGDEDSTGFTGDGVNVNSGFLDGLPTPQAQAKITKWLEERGLGRKTVQYKLRDWLFSRQRYWGEPFPIVWKDGAHYPLSESELPLVPPALPDFKPTEEGEPPLARAVDWVNMPDGSRRETNTMPQWAGSCWYYLRYIDPRNDDEFCSNELERYWMRNLSPDATGGAGKTPTGDEKAGVDLYVGGTEHAVLHLLYARFWHKVLYDLGYVSTPEPFQRLVNQGLILGEDGQKMSKSRGNVINPDDVLAEYGADAFRLYEMFMGPLDMVKPWSTKGVEGVYRFLGRVWRLFIDPASQRTLDQGLTSAENAGTAVLEHVRLNKDIRDVEAGEPQLKALHSCIKKVTEDIEALRFNTAISALMVFVNEAMSWEVKPAGVLAEFLKLLNPFSPHIAEELYQKLSASTGENALEHCETVAYQPWPEWDEKYMVESIVELPVQVNGKLRDKITVQVDADKESIEKAALESERVRSFIDGKEIKKVIIVPNKVVNIAVSK